MKLKRRPIFQRLMAHSALGLVIATAIAQLAGLFGEASPPPPVLGVPIVQSFWNYGEEYVVYWEEQRGFARCHVEWFTRDSVLDSVTTLLSIAGEDEVKAMAPPVWSRIGDADRVNIDPNVGRIVAHREYAVGWPMLSFRCRARMGDRAPAKSLTPWAFDGPVVGMFSETVVSGEYRLHQRFLTLDPIWPGLAASTAFWGLTSIAVSAAAGRAVRQRRIAKGLCPKCRYNLRGLPSAAACPECGSVCHSPGRGTSEVPRSSIPS